MPLKSNVLHKPLSAEIRPRVARRKLMETVNNSTRSNQINQSLQGL